MIRAFYLRLAVILIVLPGLASCSLLRESPTPPPGAGTPNPEFPVVRVSADQAARAMEQDHFFSDYGYTTLIIQGTVSAVERQGTDLIVHLDTSLRTKVLCNLGGYAGIVRVRSTITVQSVYPQRDVSRQPSALVIKNCTIP